MKKLLLLLFSIPLVLSCEKSGINGPRPDERLSETLAQYGGLLVSAPHGWKAHLFTGGGGGYGFLLRFNGENRVAMFADISEETGSKVKESSYRLKAALLPSIYFDTYSYIHLLADPDPAVYEGIPGWGKYSDFEFSFIEVKDDTVRLRGNLNGSQLVLVRANAEEAKAYSEGNLNTLRDRTIGFFEGRKFSYLEDAAGNVFGTVLDLDRKTLKLMYSVADTVAIKTLGVALSGTNELWLSDTFRAERLQIDRLLFDAKSNEVVAAYGGQTFPFWESDRPPFPLFQLWGTAYETIRVPMETASTGNGAEFDARREAFLREIRKRLQNTTFPEMQLILDTKEKLLFVNQVVRQGDDNFRSIFVFSYKQDGETFTFRYEGTADGNAAFLEEAYVPVLEGFLYGAMRFNYNLQLDALRASGESSDLPGFKFVGALR